MGPLDNLQLTSLSHELLCFIIEFLPLKETLLLSTLCKKLNDAVTMYLHLCKTINLADDAVFGHMYSSINDEHLNFLLRKCTHLEIIYGLHPKYFEYRKLRKETRLTLPGIIEALHQPRKLQAVEISDLCLMESILRQLPHINIIGHFRNNGRKSLIEKNYKLKLPSYSHIMSLHLTGVKVAELTAMPQLQHLYLQCVHFTKLHPFRSFVASNLKTFVMRHSVGPSVAVRYLPLIVALSSSSSLSRLELIRVPILGGMIQRAVEDSWRDGGFTKLKTLVIADCKSILETDIGSLIIVTGHHLENLALQPSLTKDSLFISLSFAQCDFSKLKTLQLGYTNEFPSKEVWSKQLLMDMNSSDVSDTPALITDKGMKIISTLFPNLKSVSISNCPHLKSCDTWYPEGTPSWKKLTDLTLHHCHCLRLQPFLIFLSQLPSIETLILESVFRVPSRGCTRMRFSGLSGLGIPDDEENADDDVQEIPDDKQCSDDEHLKNSHSSEQNLAKSSLDAYGYRNIESNNDASHFTNRGTQTSNQHIREPDMFPTLKPRHKRSTRNRDVYCGEGTSKGPVSQENIKKNENKCDKSTSTGDLFDDGHEQIFRLVSETLVSLSVVSSDLSDIMIDYSRKLLHIKALACRILKNIQLRYCPSLMRVQVLQCPKINISNLASNIMSIPAERGRVVYYEPFEKDYDEKIIEKAVFDNPNYDYDVYLLHDFTSSADSAMYCERLFIWIRLLAKISSSLLKCKCIPLSKRCDRYIDSYPWGNNISYMQGMFPSGHYSFLTNSPWFRELCWNGDLTKQVECLPSPESFSHEILNNMHYTLADVIAELNETKKGIYENHIGFYICIQSDDERMFR